MTNLALNTFDDIFAAAIDESIDGLNSNVCTDEVINSVLGTDPKTCGNFNSVLADSCGNVDLKGLPHGEAWTTAIDAVDYPVEIHPAFYLKDDTFSNGKSLTNTGRESQFQMIVVDKLRNGQFNPIACVSDTYGTVSTATAYQELREQLDEKGIKYSVKSLYVSGNGGSQLLNIQFDDVMDMAGIPDRISLMIQFASSVDGSKSHTVNLFAYNHDIDAVFDFSGSVQRLSARHTTTMAARTINFIPAIIKLIENWNDQIVPFMMLMRDSSFDRNLAVKLVEEISTDAQMGERHTSQIVEIIGRNVIDRDTEYSLYDLNNVIGKYINDEMEDKPERQQKAIRDLGKAIRKAVKKHGK